MKRGGAKGMLESIGKSLWKYNGGVGSTRKYGGGKNGEAWQRS